jgi:DNA helicase HerA-like ATPase
MLIVDEAHFFAPQKRSVSIQKLSTEALSVFAHDSRKAGVGTLFLTQRNAAISKSVIFDSNVRIFGRMSHMPDFKAIKEYSPDLEYIQVSSLRTGEAYLVSPRGAIKITFNLRETAALGDTPLFVSQIDKLPDGSDFADETTVRIAGSMGGDWEKV